MTALTLTDFLLARISETSTDVHTSDCDKMHPSYVDGLGPLSTECDCGYPARVLAECEAKRRIVQDIGNALTYRCVPGGPPASGELPLPLRALSAVYADHPDYREEWGV